MDGKTNSQIQIISRKQQVSLSTLQYNRCRRREMDRKSWKRKIEKWKSWKVEKWKSGKVEEWKSGKLDKWKSGKVENTKSAKLEGGKMEKWKVEKSKSGRRQWRRETMKKWKTGIVKSGKVDSEHTERWNMEMWKRWNMKFARQITRLQDTSMIFTCICNLSYYVNSIIFLSDLFEDMTPTKKIIDSLWILLHTILIYLMILLCAREVVQYFMKDWW